jgi:hypothetical protein
MRYRAQTTTETHSATHCTLVKLADSADVRPRAFQSFRKLQDAVNFVAKCGEAKEPKLRKSQYSSDPRDVRFTVNYYGSPKKNRVKLAPKRVIMTAGITLDRLLPVLIQRD